MIPSKLNLRHRPLRELLEPTIEKNRKAKMVLRRGAEEDRLIDEIGFFGDLW